MKKWVIILFICCFTNSFSQTNISPNFSKLKGMEGQQGKSNLSPIETLNLYPLSVGNTWVYLNKSVSNPWVTYYITKLEVVGDSLAPNGKLYYHLKKGTDHYLERVDSLNGIIYRYYESSYLPENEYLIADLLGEVGDTVSTFYALNPNFQTWITSALQF